jgi:4-hydroxy-tetrahydrodipicolinate reductase
MLEAVRADPMRIGIVGAGKMGREIAAAAQLRGHQVAWTLRSADNPGGGGLTPEKLSAADVVFEFTAPAAAVENLLTLARGGARVVCGTTGWSADLPRVMREFQAGEGALVHASNFSIGVRHYRELARAAARLYPQAGYAPFLVEEHHAAKRDAPSGTAKTIAEIVERESGVKMPISSVRAGTIPGTHRLVFESPEDEVELVHRARGRAGFAKGAVWAGERIAGRTGVFEFGELIAEVK